MSQPKYVTALDLKEPATLDADIKKYFDKCVEKLGLVPNVLRAYAFDQNKLRGFMTFYNELMLGESGLGKLEREMIAVAVSATNRCFYCVVAHGAAVRQYSGDPALGELMAINYRVAELSPRHRAMLDFAVKMTERGHEIGEPDRQRLREAGFSDRDIWDIAAVASFFNMSNRMASAVDMIPNPEYHKQAR
ncbi:MAG: peroxidase-related enzyme [Alphaproteobacteria bacterium]|nr:peroxidase-related enzyme [Alphaproteobacteria bacterium]